MGLVCVKVGFAVVVADSVSDGAVVVVVESPGFSPVGFPVGSPDGGMTIVLVCPSVLV